MELERHEETLGEESSRVKPADKLESLKILAGENEKEESPATVDIPTDQSAEKRVPVTSSMVSSVPTRPSVSASVFDVRPEVEKTEAPQKPAAFSSSTASRELSIGSGPPETAVSVGRGPPEPAVSVGRGPPEPADSVGRGPPEPAVSLERGPLELTVSVGRGPPEPAVSVGRGPPEPAAEVGRVCTEPPTTVSISSTEPSKPLFSFTAETAGPKANTFGTPVANLFGGSTTNSTTGTAPNVFGGSTATPPSSTEGAPSVFGGALATVTTATPSVFGGGVSVTSVSGSPATPQKDDSQVLPSGVKTLDESGVTGTAGVDCDEGSQGGRGKPVEKTTLLSAMLGAEEEEETPARVGSATDKSAEKLASVSSSVASTALVRPSVTAPIFVQSTESVTSMTGLFGNASGTQFSSKTKPAMFAKPIFGGSPVTEADGQTGPSAKPAAVTTAMTSGFFGQTSGTQFSFGGTNPAPFGASTTGKSIFGGSPVTDTDSQTGPSAKPATVTTATPTGLFGGVSTTTTANLFGTTSTTTTPSIFGGVTTATSTPSIFGGITTATTAPSIFGGSATATTVPFFGVATTTTATAAPSVFGGSATATTAPLFGVATTTTTTAAPSVFGGVTTATTTPLFGTGATTTGPLFGGDTVAAATPAFGNVTTTTTATLFGGSTTTTSVFGGLALQTTSSVFGGQAPAVPSSGGASIFGQQGSTFGQPATTASVFGGQPTMSASMFGEHQAAPAFGMTATFGQTPASTAFGQTTPGGLFGQTSTPSSGGVFGSGGGGGGVSFGGLGGKPSAENANKNVFGTTQTFGPNQQSTSLFGGQTSDKFNTVKTTAGFGLSFGGGATGSVMSSGFGFQSPTTATASPDGTRGTTVKFVSVPGVDTLRRDGNTHFLATRHQCMTAMKIYERQSLEELRLQDYIANKSVVNQDSPFISEKDTNNEAIINGEQLSKHKTGSMSDVAPSAEEQRRIVAALEQEPLGVYGYTVAKEWYEQWQIYVGYETPDTTDRPGSLTMHENCNTVFIGIIHPIRSIPDSLNMLVDEKIWCKWVEWYGVADSHKLDRYRQTNSPQAIFEICMLRSCNIRVKHPTKSVEITEECGYIELQLRRMFGVSADRKTRLWVCEKKADERFQLMSDRSTPINTVFPMLNSHCPDYQYPVDLSSSYSIALEDCRRDETWLTSAPTTKECSNEYFAKYLPLTGGPLCPNAEEKELAVTVKAMSEGISNTLQETVGGVIELGAKMKQVSETQKELDEKLRVVHVEEKELKAKEEQLKRERAKVKEDRKKLQLEIERMSKMNKIHQGSVTLNVGGHVYTTSKLTLNKDKDSILAAMFSDRHFVQREEDGSYFIDRDGTHFRYILNYLRDGCFKNDTHPSDVTIVGELLTEAEYYQLNGLVTLLKDYDSGLRFRFS